jgi:tetratricopeptide (TPR) repeat protein
MSGVSNRRLGELYLDVREYQRRPSGSTWPAGWLPGDIFTLRALGQAFLGGDQPDEAGRVIDDFARPGPDAFARTIDCGALKGRYWSTRADTKKGRHQEAEDVYRQACERNPDSYYLADLLAQVRLELGDHDGASMAYAQALEVIDRLPEQNLWVETTAAPAAIVTGVEDKVLVHLARVQALHPTQENLEAIERGLRRCQRALGFGEDRFIEWQKALRS